MTVQDCVQGVGPTDLTENCEEAIEDIETAADPAETVYTGDIRNTIRRYISQGCYLLCYASFRLQKTHFARKSDFKV